MTLIGAEFFSCRIRVKRASVLLISWHVLLVFSRMLIRVLYTPWSTQEVPPNISPFLRQHFFAKYLSVAKNYFTESFRNILRKLRAWPTVYATILAPFCLASQKTASRSLMVSRVTWSLSMMYCGSSKRLWVHMKWSTLTRCPVSNLWQRTTSRTWADRS